MLGIDATYLYLSLLYKEAFLQYCAKFITLGINIITSDIKDLMSKLANK